MKKIPKWPVAQVGEKGLWDGVVHLDYYILRVLAGSSVPAPVLRKCFPEIPQTCLELGIGPFGLGLLAFLPEYPNRFGVDPLPRVSMESTNSSPLESSEEIRSYMRKMRASIQYIQGCGEEIPVRSESMDLVICCNVLDHTSDPDAVLREIRRVLKPNGKFFFNVDTFSRLGLVKWHLLTKHLHRDEIMVTTHPYRMYEADAEHRLRKAGFQLKKVQGHTFVSNLIGHSRDSTYLGTKCSP
ncbi:MAG: methyltransferase domain-containing protein [Candidatus Acidiferrales bacterium]